MDDGVGTATAYRILQLAVIAHIRAQQRHPSGRRQLLEIGGNRPVHQGLHLPAMLEKAAHRIATDKAGRAGYKYRFHLQPFSLTLPSPAANRGRG